MSKRKHWHRVFLPGGTSHADWLDANASKYTTGEIATVLGRTKDSVVARLKRVGLEHKGQIAEVQGREEAEQVEGIPVDSLLQFIKDKGRTLKELSLEFDRSEDTMRQAIEKLLELSYEITQTEQQQHLWSTKIPKIVAPPTILWDKDTWEFCFGVMADTHDGSKGAQISARNRAINIMYEHGVRDVIVVGDINAGRNVYRGQHLDVVSMEPDDQVAITEAYWPHKDDMRFHMVGGNHDYSILRSSGYNALKDLCKKRDDFLYYGYDLMTVPLTENVDALAWHPSGGTAYALSYRSQKMVEQVAFEQLMEVIEKNVTPKVRFLFVGHWHNTLLGYFKGPILVQHTGCFEGQTNYLKRKGLYPEIGAVILEGKITKDRNLIRNMSVNYLRFTEIEDDYLSYPIPQEDKLVTQPIFQWNETSKEK